MDFLVNFLPTDYNKNEKLNESSGRYMHLKTGENKFRVLGNAIVGWEWWESTVEGRRTPKRVKLDQKIKVSTVEDPESIRRFWAFPVWNYELEKVQILEIVQKRIQTILKNLVNNKDWGSPINYDVSIVRTGETLQDTRYEVIPFPPKPLDPKIKEEFEKTFIDLELLFDGLDPFVPIAQEDLQITAKDLEKIG